MNIKNKPIVNRDPHSAILNQLRQTIKELNNENEQLKNLLSESGVSIRLGDLKPCLTEPTHLEEELKIARGRHSIL